MLDATVSTTIIIILSVNHHQDITLIESFISDMAVKQCLDNGDWFSVVEGNPFQEWTDYRWKAQFCEILQVSFCYTLFSFA